MNSQEILRLLNWIAKLIPPLAKGIEKITSELLVKTPTTQEILEKRLQSSPIVKLELEETPKDDAPILKTNLQDDSSKAKNAVDELHSVLPQRSIPGINQPQDSEQHNISSAVQETFLRQIELDFQENNARIKEELKRKQSREAAVFRLMLISGIFSLFLVILGAYSFIQNGLNILAFLAEILGLMTGSGTAILRQLQTDLKQKAEVIEKKQDEQTRYLRAIQTALSLRGSERDQQLTETAKWLRESAKTNNQN